MIPDNHPSLLSLLEEPKFPQIPEELRNMKIGLRLGRANLLYQEPGWHGKKHYEYVESYVTKAAGTIEHTEWVRKFTALLERADPSVQNLFDKLLQHAQKLAWLHTDKERYEYAANCLCSEVFRHWDDFSI